MANLSESHALESSGPSPNRPRLTVVLGGVNAGKTEWCLSRFAESNGGALLLVPSRGYAEHVRRCLQKLHSDASADNISTFGEMLRAKSKLPGSSLVHRTCQRIALAGIVNATIESGSFFALMRETPGFASSLGASIRELKLSSISPDSLEAAVRAAAAEVDDPAFAPKCAAITALFRAYQEFLEANGLSDEEDLPEVAARRIADRGPLDANEDGAPRTVLIDGFYRFSRSWREVLAALAASSDNVIVTLPIDESRPLLFTSAARTLAILESEFEVRRIVPAAASGPSNRSAASLRFLEDNLFRQGAPLLTASQTVDPSGEPSIRIFDAPNTYTEAEMVIRAIHRERSANGTPLRRCAIIVRSPGEYAELLRAVGKTYGIDVDAGQGQSLADQPIAKSILTLCSIFLSDWRREDVVGFLKSSYVPANRLAADSLRLKARRKSLRQGRDGWRALLESAGEKSEPLAPILGQMLAFDAALSKGPGSAADIAGVLNRCIDSVGIRAREEDGSIAALSAVKETIEQLAVAAQLTGAPSFTFAEFHRNLAAAMRATPFSPLTNEKRDSVPLIEPYDAGQLDADLVVVMGLTERVFPRRVVEDPFFRDDERDALRLHGLDLERQSDRSDDERLLFYLAAASANRRLILTFPRSSDESDSLPSFYLDEVRSLFEHVPTEIRTLTDVAPRSEECVTSRDRILSACAAFAEAGDGQSDNVTESILGLTLSPDEAAAVESARESIALPRLPSLLPRLREIYGEARRYSITEIETYNTCPFQHMMRYGLKARALIDGAGAVDRGTLFHKVMGRVFRRRRDSGADSRATDPADLHAELVGELTSCLKAEPVDASPHRRRMMERSLRDTLHEMAAREVRYASLFQAIPSWFELSFGQEPDSEADDAEIGLDEKREYDADSTPMPLMIPGDEGEPSVQLCGAIDRVDLLADGRRAIVLDYKLGNSVEWDRIKQGKSLQMPLYLLAIERLWERSGAVACYESPKDRGRRRFYRRTEVDIRVFQPIAGVEDGKLSKPIGAEEYMEASLAAQNAVRFAVAGIRNGHVIPTPGEHCRFCDYADVCRMGRDGIHDGEHFNATGPMAGAPLPSG